MEQSMQWFVFFKDQLLLKKEYTTNGENKYGIPPVSYTHLTLPTIA